MKKSFYLNTAGFRREVLQADFMQNLVNETAAEVAGKAGGGYDYMSKVSMKRAVAMVWADDFEAKKDDYENNTLLKAVYPLQVGPDKGKG